jgi:hypothetical protein
MNVVFPVGDKHLVISVPEDKDTSKVFVKLGDRKISNVAKVAGAMALDAKVIPLESKWSVHLVYSTKSKVDDEAITAFQKAGFEVNIDVLTDG